MKCWHCGTSQQDPSWGKISFRAVCERCNAALHCCQNCQFYKPGHSNDCAIPNAETVSDRQANNFCEEFSINKNPSKKNTIARNRFDNLFK